MQASNTPGNLISNMQLAPLVDISLVLVIIFMVTAPIINTPGSLQVDLPKAATIEANSEDNLTITLATSGEIALNQNLLPLSKLEPVLRDMVAQHPDRLVLIRADKQASHRQVLELLGIAKKSGAKKLAIATVQRPRQ
ncbi:MAG: biopolymer transporter ExbD [candidate division KSB1 bacterium]|nr:biopolymer transporter ExbD [candidate division KSB1 bacterium]MDZ7302056.1 biopolymer transporter ExbD [candidate division KSB1 bacterium]MDZ7311098.1 biopolymer transporter ExbD [candidate division KSB1 bacterium]